MSKAAYDKLSDLKKAKNLKGHRDSPSFQHGIAGLLPLGPSIEIMKSAINPNYQHFSTVLDNVPEYFAASSDSIHKARNELKLADIQGEQVVLKSFQVPNRLRRFIYTYLRSSKAERSYENALLLGSFTPAPIAFIEYHKAGLIDRSYFISEHFAYDFTIREPLLDLDFPNREGIFKAFARFTLALHDAGFLHKDYSPGNILIKQKPDQSYEFKIVDVNRMQLSQLSDDQRARGFEKLWARDIDLEIMAAEYAQHSQKADNFSEQVKAYSNRNKRFKRCKKHLKERLLHGKT